ncbi:MAG: hypothetical protein LUE92_13385 [Clostridiales bacterium]|nr:hypothetical protein [Clostridiales bacterium]
MSTAEFCDMDKRSVMELSEWKSETGTEKEKKVVDYLKQNSEGVYVFRIGKVIVQFDYLHNGRTLNDMFAMMVQASL